MTETAQPENPLPKAPAFTREQIDQIKIALINNFANTYNNFIATIRNLPGEPNIKEEAFKYMYVGFVLFKDAIVNMNTDGIQPAPTPAPAPQPQAQQETTPAPEVAPTQEAPAPIEDSAPVDVPPAA